MIDFEWHIQGEPQIERDSTSYNNKSYIDGRWTRFYNRKPKKMGGYKFLQAGSSSIVRNLFEVSVSGGNDVYSGYNNALVVTYVDTEGTAGVPRDRTPVGFIGDPNLTWKFALVTYSGVQYILAIPIPNLTDINNMTPGTLYYGRTDNNSPLMPVLDDFSVPIAVTGGVTVIGSVIFVYGLNGLIRWNNGLSVSGPVSGQLVWNIVSSENIGAENVIYGAPVRDGQVTGGLFWAVQGLLKATNVGSTLVDDITVQNFSFSYISFSCTILSSNCVVSYDPYFFWCGRDTFYIYNGVVAELPNQVNRLFFFENLQQNNAARVFGFFNTQYQEVWWGWANGDVLENNAALIYNKNYQTWYDTGDFYRSAGVNTSSVFPYPICSSSKPFLNGTYPLWQHEIGLDLIYGGNVFAIPAYIQTKYVDNPELVTFVADDLIFDIKQIGTMSVRVSKQGYPRTTAILSDPVFFQPTDERLTLREKGTLLSFIFQSNAIGGDYYFGDTVIKITGDEDERPGPVNV